MYVRNKNLFSGLVYIAVGFVLLDRRFDPGMQPSVPASSVTR